MNEWTNERKQAERKRIKEAKRKKARNNTIAVLLQGCL